MVFIYYSSQWFLFKMKSVRKSFGSFTKVSTLRKLRAMHRFCLLSDILTIDHLLNIALKLKCVLNIFLSNRIIYISRFCQAVQCAMPKIDILNVVFKPFTVFTIIFRFYFQKLSWKISLNMYTVHF